MAAGEEVVVHHRCISLLSTAKFECSLQGSLNPGTGDSIIVTEDMA